MYTFNDETLKYLLSKIKDQLDERQDKQQYLIQVDPETEGALIIGTDEIDEDLVNASGFLEGTAVLVKNMIATEVNFTLEEKKALNSSSNKSSQQNILDERLAGAKFQLISVNDFQWIKRVEGLEPGIFYIVSDNIDDPDQSIIVALDNYIKEGIELKEFNENKINKIEGKQLSQEDFTDLRKTTLDEINGKNYLFTENIIDNLSSNSSNDMLSAYQGKILKDEYLGGYSLEFSEPENDIYGLSESQMKMLGKIYSDTLINTDKEFADKKEVFDARKNNEGKLFDTLYDRIDSIESNLRNVALNIDHIEDITDYYGVQFDFEEQECTRYGKTKNADFNTVYPWAGMKRCNVLNGEIVAYEGDTSYKEDGSNGDVMVEIPKFWYKVIPVKTEPSSSLIGDQLLNARWLISNKNANGFKVHPAFIRNNQEVDYIYVSAFEGCIYSMSSNNYLYEDEQIMNSDVDKLCSISGAKPATGTTQNLTITNFRRLAKNKGNTYGLLDFTTLSALQLLFLIEHASFNVQEKIGQGITNSDTLVKTGHSDAATYRGIENLWGNIWCFIEGINIELNNQEYWTFAYWSNDSDKNDTADEHTKINFKLCRDSYGYIDRFGYDRNNDFVFLPTRVTGSEAIAPHDIYNHDNTFLGWLVPVFGGKWNSGNSAGLWAYSIYDSSSYYGFNISSRVMFYK